jgi:hypothetical protein
MISRKNPLDRRSHNRPSKWKYESPWANWTRSICYKYHFWFDGVRKDTALNVEQSCWPTKEGLLKGSANCHTRRSMTDTLCRYYMYPYKVTNRNRKLRKTRSPQWKLRQYVVMMYSTLKNRCWDNYGSYSCTIGSNSRSGKYGEHTTIAMTHTPQLRHPGHTQVLQGIGTVLKFSILYLDDTLMRTCCRIGDIWLSGG